MPAMAVWRDPIEGAFTCPVPQGWKVEGGLKRFSVADVRPEVLATSPDNSILVRIGDSFIASLMTLPTQMGAQYGSYEGGVETNAFGSKMPILRYLPSTAFLTQVYIPQRLGQVSNVKAQDRPQTVSHAYGAAVFQDVGWITFDASGGSGPRKGGIYIETQLMPATGGFPGAGTWFVKHLYAYLAEPKAEALAATILTNMVKGFQTDPGWNARQTDAMFKVHGSVRQAQQATFDTINQAYADRSRSQDRMFENWSRAFRDEVLIQDPTTGEKFEVPSGSNYYFRVGSGDTFVGTDTAAAPYSPNHWLREMRIGN